MRQKNRRIMAAGMAAVTLCTSLVSAPVYAAEASVSVDEAMYVNLDYYGSVDKVNVVKGVSLNGLTSFTDYGNYLDVTNMTNNTAPEISDGKVTWNLPADTKGYFYYKGAIDKDAVTLPWTMDVSYKLNGVPTDAEKLAGASGLVEVHVTATPNEAARDYYKNNMMLVVAMLVDMSKCYSVEAEDSQTQSLGSQTAIMYTALPGEEGDYTIRIGSDKFETSGVIMAMVPGTVKDLEHIVDLKDAKDTWKDAGDQLYDSMDQMAASVEAMRSGVNELRQGLNEAESARGIISGSKDEILDSNDQTLASLTALSEQLGTIVPYIQTAKDASEVAHNSMTDVVNTLGNMQEPIRRLDTSLRGLRDSSEGASGSIGNVVASVQLIKKLDTQLQQSVLEFIKNLASAQESMQDAIADYCNGEAGDGVRPQLHEARRRERPHGHVRDACRPRHAALRAQLQEGCRHERALLAPPVQDVGAASVAKRHDVVVLVLLGCRIGHGVHALAAPGQQLHRAVVEERDMADDVLERPGGAVRRHAVPVVLGEVRHEGVDQRLLGDKVVHGIEDFRHDEVLSIPGIASGSLGRRCGS